MEQHSEPDQQQHGQAATPERVCATEAARGFIGELRSRHGPLMFFQSGGCCDGSAPMCYPLDEFSVSDTDVRLGAIDGTPFYIGREQFGYWAHTQLIIDVVPGNGGMFSLDNGTGKRFLTRSRLFRDDELARLQAAFQATPAEPASVQAPPSAPVSAQAPPS
jgi:hypothetical protein